jgi:hypothetical protein
LSFLRSSGIVILGNSFSRLLISIDYIFWFSFLAITSE